MKQFNVLDRQLNLHQHYLLEASAGTGKTFSIQNIMIRLLIESSPNQKNPLTINEILVVTFTRAATRDLRRRIRSTIEQVIQYLTQWLENQTISDSIADYLLYYFECGIDFVEKAKKRLQQALFMFDQAQIFTIHGFCARMLQQYALETDMGINIRSKNGEEPLPTAEVMRIIRDFFRTEIRNELYSPAQLAIILKQDPKQRKLLRAIISGYEFIEMPTYQNLYDQFKEVIQELKQSLNLNSANMIADFKAQYSFYRNYKSGETKAETLVKITRFAALWDQVSWSVEDFDLILNDGLVWVHALNPKLLKNQSSISEKLHYPDLTNLLRKRLEPLIAIASDFSILLARLSRDCQRLLKRYQIEEEKLSPDDLLRKMHWALNQPVFLSQIQSLYQAAIIDEFQDTDPIQWDIFQRLFIPKEGLWQGNLYLVGDPKQSIYSFRQADIYTYLAAAQVLGKEHCFSLDTNYRSQPSLVQALNTLFAIEHIPKLIPLPKRDFHLPYQPVHSSINSSEKHFEDEKGSVHFFIGDGKKFKKPKLSDWENQIFFPFIAQEIEQLRQQGIHYCQFAVLVRDRHQAIRLAAFFDKHKIPYMNQRGISLAESIALFSLIDILRAILHPQDLGAIKTALGSPLIGWTHEDLKNSNELSSILIQIHQLKHCLFKHGFSHFFQKFLQSKWLKDGFSVCERLLTQENGIEFYHDLQQIVHIIIAHQYREWNTPEGLIPFLDLFQVWHDNEDERIKRFQDPTKDAVKILTLHFSKGLEFDIVFALGLINRVNVREDLFPVEHAGQIVLAPLAENTEEYGQYCEEIDAEKMRQLYVAMTRPKYRLYIPVVLHLPSDGLAIGGASPMDLFLARLGQQSVSYQELYSRIKSFDHKILINFLESIGKGNFISYSTHEQLSFERKKEYSSPKELHPPRDVQVFEQDLMMASFSSLTHHLLINSKQKETSFTPPHDFDHSQKNPHTLPASSETGILLHQILEKINYQDFKSIYHPDQATFLLRPFVQKTCFKDWLNVINLLIFNGLKTPLFLKDQYFCLADLPAHQMYREMPFLFPYESKMAIEGVTFSEGFIKGVIDLIFIHQEKYYIVDWKSNWLGPNLDAYQSANLETTMRENQYFLQAALYTEALRRYVKLVDNRLFEDCFGGIIYIFIRGIDGQEKTGIYHFLPNQVVQEFSSNQQLILI